MGAVFKFSTDSTSIEVEGPEGFLREQVAFLAPFVRRTAGGTPGSPAGAAGNGTPVGLEGLPAWWSRSVPRGATPSIQDSVLVFAYFMRTYRKTVFLSEDIRRCFHLLGMEEPRSLLQILGNLKRELGLLLPAGKRGEYMMNTTGIARARDIVGERPAAAPPAGSAAPAAPVPPPPTPPTPPTPPQGRLPDIRNIFKD